MIHDLLAEDSSITDIINLYSNMIYKLAIIQTKNKADAEDEVNV